MNLPLQLKLLVPGYRGRWRLRYACMISEIESLMPRLSFGVEQETPYIDLDGGPRLYGFATESANVDVYALLRGDLPAELPLTHFRLVKDCLTRYVYPHMRPDLKPNGFPVDQMFGFHGQHKDAIADLDDASARAELVAAFTPLADDVVIDCGAFLGFGDLRMAETVTAGRIVAIEANRSCHALLGRNLRANGVENVTALHRAVWNRQTELELETGFAQSNTLVAEVYTGPTTEPVQTVTIDEVVAEHDLAKVDMLSLTLNGAEVEALEGAARTLRRFGPRIRLAGWYSRGGRKIWELTKAVLEDAGYRVFVGRRGNVMALPGRAA